MGIMLAHGAPSIKLKGKLLDHFYIGKILHTYRHNMSPTETTMRTLTSICQDAKDNKNGCKFEPLLSIELDHVIPDKLHLLLSNGCFVKKCDQFGYWP